MRGCKNRSRLFASSLPPPTPRRPRHLVSGQQWAPSQCHSFFFDLLQLLTFTPRYSSSVAINLMFSFFIQRKQLFLIFSYWGHYSFTSSCRCGSFEGFVISWRCTLSMLVTRRSQYISIPGAARWAQKLFHPFNTHGKVVVSKYKFPDRVIRKSIRSQYFPLPRLFRLLLLQHFKLVQVFLGGCGVVVVVDHVASFYSQLSLYYTFPSYTRLVFRGLWMYLLLPLLLRRSVRRSALENVIRLRSRCRSPKRKERKKRGGRGKAVGASFLIVRRRKVCVDSRQRARKFYRFYLQIYSARLNFQL